MKYPEVYRNSSEVQQRIDYLRMYQCRKSVRVEQVFDPYHDDQMWYYIPGFNGYEISDHWNVRSLKNFNTYPFGIIPKLNSNGLYELSTNNNVIVDVSTEQLWKLALDQLSGKYPDVSNNPCPTYIVRATGRNSRKFIDYNAAANTKGAKRKPVPGNKQPLSYASFSVKEDKPKLIKPIRFEEDNNHG